MIVYSFVLEDSIEEIETANLASPALAWELPHRGASALLKIKRIEAEASYTMLRAGRAHHGHHERVRRNYLKHFSRKYLKMGHVLEYDLIWRRSHTVEMISREIEHANCAEELREALHTDFRKYLHYQQDSHEISMKALRSRASAWS